MAATPVQPAGWPRPHGYSNGMRARGQLVAVAGQIGWDASGRLVSPTFAAQFEQALANVVTVVSAAGGSREDLISLTLYVTSRAEYLSSLTEVGAAYRRVVGKHYPAMALVEVAGLLEVGAKVEIQALAVVPSD
jgi:enamine deaminase RidA (YjgF/YER057c/UK114 family)